jgi:hypothetical protein
LVSWFYLLLQPAFLPQGAGFADLFHSVPLAAAGLLIGKQIGAACWSLNCCSKMPNVELYVSMEPLVVA